MYHYCFFAVKNGVVRFLHAYQPAASRYLFHLFLYIFTTGNEAHGDLHIMIGIGDFKHIPIVVVKLLVPKR